LVVPPPTFQVWNAAPVSGCQRVTPRDFFSSLVKETFPILPSGSTSYQGQGWIGMSNSPHLEGYDSVRGLARSSKFPSNGRYESQEPISYRRREGGHRLRMP